MQSTPISRNKAQWLACAQDVPACMSKVSDMSVQRQTSDCPQFADLHCAMASVLHCSLCLLVVLELDGPQPVHLLLAKLLHILQLKSPALFQLLLKVEVDISRCVHFMLKVELDVLPSGKGLLKRELDVANSVWPGLAVGPPLCKVLSYRDIDR